MASREELFSCTDYVGLNPRYLDEDAKHIVDMILSMAGKVLASRAASPPPQASATETSKTSETEIKKKDKKNKTKKSH